MPCLSFVVLTYNSIKGPYESPPPPYSDKATGSFLFSSKLQPIARPPYGRLMWQFFLAKQTLQNEIVSVFAAKVHTEQGILYCRHDHQIHLQIIFVSCSLCDSPSVDPLKSSLISWSVWWSADSSPERLQRSQLPSADLFFISWSLCFSAEFSAYWLAYLPPDQLICLQTSWSAYLSADLPTNQLICLLIRWYAYWLANPRPD